VSAALALQILTAPAAVERVQFRELLTDGEALHARVGSYIFSVPEHFITTVSQREVRKCLF
jgi:hypothetical protein